MDDKFLTAAEAAEFLACSKATVLRRARKGLIQHARIGTGPRAPYRFTKQWLVDSLHIEGGIEGGFEPVSIPLDSEFAKMIASKRS